MIYINALRIFVTLQIPQIDFTMKIYSAVIWQKEVIHKFMKFYFLHKHDIEHCRIIYCGLIFKIPVSKNFLEFWKEVTHK